MTRKGYYVKPSREVSAPSAWVSLIVEGRPAGGGGPARATPLVFRRAHTAASRFRRGKWETPERQTFDCPLECLDWVEAWAEPRRRTSVVAPIASNALTLLHFWERMEAEGCKWEREKAPGPPNPRSQAPAPKYQFSGLVLRGKPDIVKYSVDGKSITWVSGNQYLTAPEVDLARSIGFQWSQLTGASPLDSTAFRDPADRALLWLRLMQRLCDWWRAVRGGPWGMTVAQLAERFFRSRLLPKTVCTHRDEDVKRLEERAIFGGRASVWYYGDVGVRGSADRYPVPPPPPSSYPCESGPVYLLDVRSMYPHLLGSESYPVRLAGYRENWTVKELSGLIDHVGVIASVRLAARVPEYPFRRSGRVVHPVGEFDTVLTGPELSLAARRGEVAKVYSAAVYDLGRPFSRMSDDLLRLRQQSRDAGDPAWELFVKSLSNSFAGRLALRRGSWTECHDYPPLPLWGEEIVGHVQTGDRKRYRSLAGLVFLWTEDIVSSRTLGQCFAYLTAYGRCRMRYIRSLVGAFDCLAQDTDGVWVTGDGLVALNKAGQIGRGEPGSLRVVRSEPAARWFGPKHYWTPSGWVLAGLHSFKRLSDGVTFRDSFTADPTHRSPRSAPVHVWDIERTVSLRALPVDGTVGPSGWIDPLFIR